MTFGEFLDFWKLQTKTVTDSNVARKLSISRSSVAQYRTGANYPADETMVLLAKRAHLDVEECLLILNVWRSEGEAQKFYTKMFKRFYPKSAFL